MGSRWSLVALSIALAGETDLDRGGANACPRCAKGKDCQVDGDCAGGSCSGGTCA